MTETTIRRLPDGKWQLTQRHDTLTSLMTALDSLADLGDEVQVELPKVEAWDGKFRVGDEGRTRDGRPYYVTHVGVTTITVIVHGAAFAETLQHRIDGRFTWKNDHGRDLMPPTTRGPAQ